MNHPTPACMSVLEQPKYGQYRGTPTPNPVSSTVDPTMQAAAAQVLSLGALTR
jgi:hypothetical protein